MSIMISRLHGVTAVTVRGVGRQPGSHRCDACSCAGVRASTELRWRRASYRGLLPVSAVILRQARSIAGMILSAVRRHVCGASCDLQHEPDAVKPPRLRCTIVMVIMHRRGNGKAHARQKNSFRINGHAYTATPQQRTRLMSPACAQERAS